MLGSNEIVRNAAKVGTVVPAFNIPHLPMVAPVVRAVVDLDSFAFVAVARLEWIKFQSKSLAAVHEQYGKHVDPAHVRLHLDHVPVVDEDDMRVDYLPIFHEAISLGYQSLMIDGSRLPLDQNIAETRKAADVAHEAGLPVEAELGAVLGHEAGPLPPYEELFKTGKGFTDIGEATRFVRDTGCDWLSVAIGNVHGAVSAAARDKKKVAARLNIGHLKALRDATGVPLVLHGGSGIQQAYVLAAFKSGIAKINVGTEIRQAYETALNENGSVEAAQDAVYAKTAWLIRDYFGLAGNATKLATASN
jgi:ketose-bisphosphate aldolase